jgi:hypothetical protein
LNKTLILANLDSLIAAIAGFLIILLFTQTYNIGISPDSIVYTSVARKLVSDHTLHTYNNSPLVDFPAFYPVFLAITMFITKHDILAIAPFVNALLFSLVVFFSGRIINRFQHPSCMYRWMALTFITTSVCLLSVYYMLWSETLFILLTLIFFLSLHKYFNTRTLQNLLVTALVTALSCVTRYAGISLIGTGCLLLLFDPQLTIWKKLLHLTFFTLTASSLLALILYFNFLLEGTLTGDHKQSITPFVTNLYYYGKVLFNWFLSYNRSNFVVILFGLAVIVLFVIIFIKNRIKKTPFYSYENILITFFLVYASFIIISSTLSRYDRIDNRLLAPLFIPLVLGMSGWINSIISNNYRGTRRWIIAISTLLAIIFEINQLFALPSVIKQRSYNSSKWQNSSIAKFIRVNKAGFRKDYTIYSNSNWAVYFFTGLGADPLPNRNIPQEVNDFYKEEKIYLVWFNTDANSNDLSLKEITSNKHMSLVNSFSDGSVWIYD